MEDLSQKQREALWLYAQGLTTEAVGRRLIPSTSATVVQDILGQCARKLEGRGSTNTVFRGMALGIIGPYLDCGQTRTAYDRHLRRDEPTCVACRRFNSQRVMGQRASAPDYDPEAGRAIGLANLRPREKQEITEMQIRVLCAMRDKASSSSQIAAALGIAPGTARRHVIQIMDRLDIDRETLGTVLSYKAAVTEAEKRGYLDRPLEPLPEPKMSELTKRILLASQTDESLEEIAKKLGTSKKSVAAGLSRCYALLGIEPEGHAWSSSRDRRARALKVALERGILL